MSPTARSLAKLRAEGWCVCVIEKWLPTGPAGFKGPIIRKDAWGFGDLLAVKVGARGATLVQTTSGSNFASRLTKIRGIAEAGIWLAAGNKICLMGWRKTGAAGKRKTWDCRVLDVDAGILSGLSSEE